MAPSIDLEIRKFHNDDIDQAISIAEQVRLSPWARTGFLEHLNGRDTFSLSLVSNKSTLEGFLVARMVPGRDSRPDAELLNIGVSPQLSRHGGGKRLMSGFLAWCTEHSVDRIWLEVRQSNNSAQQFYRKFGFVNVGTRKGFYSDPEEDAQIMCSEVV